jgi:hypothetical protein
MDLVVAALVLAAEHQGLSPRRPARLARPGRPGPGDHAPSGRGGQGPVAHLGQGRRLGDCRAGLGPRGVEPLLSRPLRQRARPAGAASRRGHVRRSVPLAGPHDPAERTRALPRQKP